MANDTDSGDAGTSEPIDDFDLPLTADEGASGTDAPGTEASAADQPATGATGDELPPELVEGFRREGLRLTPGETATQAYARLTHHLSRKSANHYKELRQVRDDSARAVQNLTAQLEPMLRDYYRQRHQSEIEQIAAQIPDKDTDPEGYQIWLQEEILRQNEESRREKETAEERQRRLDAERQTLTRLNAIDERGYGKVAEGLGMVDGVAADPDFTAAFDVFSESAVAGARSMFPDAEDAEIEEFVALSQRLDIRRAEVNGRDFRDVMKERLYVVIDGLVRAGLVTRAGAGAAAANGNGTKAASGRAGTAAGKGGAPTTAQRVSADAAAAARRAPSAVPSTTRPGGSGQLPDTADMDEDAYVEAALAQLLGNEEQRAMGASVNRRGR